MNILNIDEDTYLQYFYKEMTVIKVIFFYKNIERGSFSFYMHSNGKDAYIGSFLIKEEHLNQGYGKKLSFSLVLLAEELNINEISLHTKPFNHKKKNMDQIVNFYQNTLNMKIMTYNEEQGYYMETKLTYN